jgi:hypothetical protein
MVICNHDIVRYFAFFSGKTAYLRLLLEKARTML